MYIEHFYLLFQFLPLHLVCVSCVFCRVCQGSGHFGTKCLAGVYMPVTEKGGECGTPRKTSETNETREIARLENLHGCHCKTAESFPALRSFALN